MMISSSSSIDNALIEQKNRILAMIGKAEDVDGLQAVKTLLEFASDLWEANGYGYKAIEIRERIKEAATSLIFNLDQSIGVEAQQGRRAKRSYIASCEGSIKALEAFRQEL